MIIAAADGSSLSNPGPSGWAWYVDDDCWHAGGWPKGTNNKGELFAVLDLLRSTQHLPDEPLKILCDSQYVINAVTRWMPGWKRKGWKKADGKAVLNQDLLKQLDEALAGRDVSFEWVKGHAGHAMNEAADGRARAAATAYRDGTKVDHGPGFAGSEPADESVLEEVAATPDVAVVRREVAEKRATAEPGLDAQPMLGLEFDPDIDQVTGFEKELLTDKVRSNPERVRQLLHPKFSEFGASGRIWTRNRLLAEIGPMPVRVSFEPIGSERLAEDVILLRWRAVGAHSTWLRSSIWQRLDGRWRLLFSQGTQVP
ncbi:ribonuclease HI family protein [Propionimicrobium sp. PCR01-08-3]|uniref:ribonuclease HI family protein n=1 Tax=Propionimicrobium sp. PCR01-08-3 TaxID=3052086 RepID=UPI00255CC44C|nr:ribonuclease HI family protein [Propionimicrobium sp. PCR01-08-3]WIY83287.1 ribonuclease HI family protein [Propionimicrobium sp. PCR01-08-3]